MTSLSEVDLDGVVRGIVSPRELTEPTESFLDSTRRYLERMGWTRAVAGDEDFEAACRAWGVCMHNGLGLFVHGRYGCGKTSLMRLFRPILKRSHFVPLGDPEVLGCLSDGEWTADALDSDVFLDDLGAESAVTDFGVKRELAAEFIVRYHQRGKGRLFISTNLTGEEIAERYTARLTSRIKELCIPLHLKGRDKRRWAAVPPAKGEVRTLPEFINSESMREGGAA